MTQPILINNHFYPTLLNLMEQGKNHEAKLLVVNSKVEKPQDLVDSTLSTLLHYAVKFNNVEMVCYLLDLGCKIDIFDCEGNTPLMLAIINKKSKLIKSLVKQSNLKFSDIHFRNVLDAMFREQSKCSKIIGLMSKTFESSNIDNETIAKGLMDMKYLLYHAAYLNNVEVVKIMLDNGYSVNLKDPFNGNSPLHIAVNFDNLDLVHLLIEYGAGVNATNYEGKIPLNRRRSYHTHKQLEILKILVEKGSLLTSRHNNGHMQMIKILKHGNVLAVRLILRSNIDLNTQDLRGNTAIHYCSHNMMPDVFSSLMEYDFDPNILNESGFSVLHYVSLKHDLKKMLMLLQKGADVNIKSLDLAPPLHYVFSKTDENTVECIHTLLVDNETDIQYVTRNGHTILDQLNEHNYCVIYNVLCYLVLIEAQGTTIIEPLRQKIDSTDWIKSAIELHRLTLEKLKNIKIHESITMFKLLTDNERKLISYFRNVLLGMKLRDLLDWNESLIDSVHLVILKKRVTRALNIVLWQEKASLVFCETFGDKIAFAKLIIDEVMVYLNIEDLKNLAAVGNLEDHLGTSESSNYIVTNTCKRKRTVSCQFYY